MDQPAHVSRKRQFSLFVEVALIATLFALVVSAFGWLWVGKTSPFNHGVAPDVHTSPSVGVWVLATFPAAILFISVFGKLGAEWQYFLCVFVQWFIVGLALGLLVAAMRSAIK